MKASDILSNVPIGFEAEHIRKPSGAIIVDGMHIADTVQCVHCGRHWIPVKGSGNIRGWCTSCGGPTCGDHVCMKCVPFEKKLTDYEKGKIIKL